MLRISVLALFFTANVQTQEEVSWQTFNNPLVTFASGSTSLIWADRNQQTYGNGLCRTRFPSFSRAATYSSACIGATSTIYADFDRSVVDDGNGLEWVERASGSDSSACYELFTSIQCCLPVFNPDPPQSGEVCETFTGIRGIYPSGGSAFVWADSTETIERNGNAYCESRQGYDRMAAYDSECLGEDEDDYADWDSDTEEWDGRESGSANGACYRMFHSIECCRPAPAPTANPTHAPTNPPEECEGIVLPIFGCIGGCFSWDTLVVVKGKGEVTMQSLVSGDLVHVGKGIFEPIYAFGHRSENKWFGFLQISVQGIDKPIEMTRSHMIFIQNEGGTTKAIPANLLKQDDRLVLADYGTSRVVWIREVSKRGIYAPLTYSGKVAVNGVIASVYPAFNSEPSFWGVSMQSWMHLGQGPHRLVCKFGGISLCVDEMVVEEFVEEDEFGGMSPMVLNSVRLLDWLGTQGTFIQVLVGFLLTAGVFIANAIEFATERAVMVSLGVGMLTTAGYLVSALKVAATKKLTT